MELLSPGLRGAAAGARDAVADLSRSAAIAGTRPEADGHLQGAMAATARGAIFADALLGAVRAHLDELRTVAK